MVQMLVCLFLTCVMCQSFQPCLVGVLNTSFIGDNVVLSKNSETGETFAFVNLQGCPLNESSEESCVVSVNVTDPTDPVLLGEFPAKTEKFGDYYTAVQNDFLYLPDDENGLVIVNVKDKKNMYFVSSLKVPNFDVVNVFIPNHDESNYAYLGGSDGTVVIADISDPQHPMFISQVNVLTSGMSRWIHWIAIQNRTGKEKTVIMFVSTYYFLFALDIADITNPIIISKTNVVGGGGWMIMIVSNDLLYLNNQREATIDVYDVSDPETPQKLTSASQWYYAECYDFVINYELNRLYGVCYRAMIAFDVSDLKNPQLLENAYKDGPMTFLQGLEIDGEYFLVVSEMDYGGDSGGLKIFGCLD